MSVQKVLGLIALLFIVGLAVFVQIRTPTPKQGDEGTSSLRQPPAPKDLSPPRKLTERQSSITAAEDDRETTQSIPRQSSAPKASSSPGALPAEQSGITVKDGRLSVWLQDRPLSEVLEEIMQKGMVAIIVKGIEDQRVSMYFQNLPLDEGLRYILKEQDAFFFYGGEGDASASLRAVWVYPKGRGGDIAPTPAETWASTVELERKLADPDPETRARAVEALIERDRGEALDVVLQALEKEDDGVRNRVLYKALNSSVEIPFDFLAQLVRTDPVPEVRFMALTALAHAPNMVVNDLNNVLTIAVRLMTTDPSPEVRNEAQFLLDHLMATQPSE